MSSDTKVVENSKIVVENSKNKKKVFVTGDITDIDGCFGVTKYLTEGYDVIFIMNFPKYLSCTEPLTENSFGLGYNYSALDLLENVHKTKYLENPKYNSIYNYIIQNNNNNNLEETNIIVRNLLNEITFNMLMNIYKDIKGEKGQLYYHYKLHDKYFYNRMLPFHPNASKNEVHTYIDTLDNSDNFVSKIPNFTLDNLNGDDEIYFDFSGSMAFFDEEWEEEFNKYASNLNIKGVVIMGSIFSDVKAETIGPLANILNRLTCCTMNNLYDPKNTARFYEFVSGKEIFVVPNNQVKYLNDYNSEEFLSKTLKSFLEKNNIYNDSLYKYAKMYYTAARPTDRKPFDYYSALLLCTIIGEKESVSKTCLETQLYYDDEYGISLLNRDVNFITDKYYPEIPENIKKSLDEELAIVESKTLKNITVKYANIVNNDNIIEIIRNT